MKTTLVLSEDVARDIDQAIQNPLETAGVLLATLVESPNGDLRLLARGMRWVEEDAYLIREQNRLSIASQGYVGALGEAERLGATPIWFHTHPKEVSSPEPSDSDKRVDEEIAELFRLRSGSRFYGSLICSYARGRLEFTGSLHQGTGASLPIDRMWQVGSRWRLTQPYSRQDVSAAPIFDRNIRAFGIGVQTTLGDLRIAIVGSGGTGSAIAEQLVRLGVRHLLLIDNDTLTESNLTRVYGSTAADVGRPKAIVLKAHLLAIAPDLECEVVLSRITLEATARRLLESDLVFGCTDDNAGRLVLSRVPTYLMTPVIDIGVLLGSNANEDLSGIDARVTTVSPGDACLVCRDRIDVARAAVELRTPEERIRLADEGYAPALAGVDPAVVAFTTLAAAGAINELLERLIGYGRMPRPGEVLFRLHDREISTNLATSRVGHYCHLASANIGAASTDPFLGQLWP